MFCFASPVLNRFEAVFTAGYSMMADICRNPCPMAYAIYRSSTHVGSFTIILAMNDVYGLQYSQSKQTSGTLAALLFCRSLM